MVEMIALTIDNNVCIVDNQIPVILKAHLERFREMICGKVVVMGSKTLDSINCVPFSLADETVVLTRNGKHYGHGIIPMSSLVQIMDTYKDFIVIGGASVFADFMPIAEKIYITEVSEVGKGNTFKLFPSLKNFKLKNPDADMLNEGDYYYRLLTYVK